MCCQVWDAAMHDMLQSRAFRVSCHKRKVCRCTHLLAGATPCWSSKLTACNDCSRRCWCAPMQTAMCSAGEPSQVTEGLAPPASSNRAHSTCPTCQVRVVSAWVCCACWQRRLLSAVSVAVCCSEALSGTSAQPAHHSAAPGAEVCRRRHPAHPLQTPLRTAVCLLQPPVTAKYRSHGDAC